MTKRILSVLAAIVLAMCSMLSVVNAAGSMALMQSQVPAPGEAFQLHILLSDNPGLKSLQCLITYDANSASLVSCVDGEYFDSFTQIPTEGGVFLIWSSDSENDNYSSGILATITFMASSDPANGSLVSLAVLEALNASGAAVTINGTTSVMQFDVEETDDDTVSAEDDGEEDDDTVSAEDDEELEEEGDVVIGDEEEEEDDDVVAADDEEEEVTTASTSSTKATTTTKKTSATTTTTEEKTSVTTTTTEEPTSATTPETTPEVTSTTPESEAEQSVSFSGDAQTVAAQKKKANGGTVFAAVMIVGITVAAIAGMEIWKRSEQD